MRRFLDELRTDVLYGLRQMARSPVLTAAAVVVLAIGIGANSALFSFVDGLLATRAPGVANADRLMFVTPSGTRESHETEIPFDYLEFVDFGQRQTVFAEVGAVISRSVYAGPDVTRDRQYANFFSARYFSAMAPRMALGRAPTADDDRTAVPDPSVVVSHRYWRTQLGGDSAALERRIVVNNVSLNVVGVLPEGFQSAWGDWYGDARPLWIPLATRALLFAGDSAFFGNYARSGTSTVGLLKTGVNPDVAAAAVRAMPPSTASDREEYIRDVRALARALYEPPPREKRQVFLMAAGLGALSIVILAIACSNVSILLLGRAVSRRREIAVRLSLGASRKRVVRQLITESAMLAVLASVGGLLVVRILNVVLRSQLAGFPYDLSITWRIVAASIAFAVGTGLVFGLTPALHATRASVSAALKEGGAGNDRRRHRLQRVFVVAEVAMSMMLVCSAGLLLRAVQLELAVDPGYTISRTVVVSGLSLEQPGYTAGATDALLTAVSERLTRLPGVEYAGVTSGLPFSMGTAFGMIEQQTTTGRRFAFRPSIAMVDTDYFDAMGIQLTRGRGIDSTDVSGSVPVAVVSDELATALWPNENPLGQTLQLTRVVLHPREAGRNLTQERTFTVVGVAKAAGPIWQRGRRHHVYVPHRQTQVLTDLSLVVRLSDRSPTTAQLLASELHAIAPDLSFTGFKSTRQHADERPGDAKGLGIGAGLAGGVALMLACVGLFAVVAFAVAQRTRETGIRLALGATPRRVAQSFFSEGMRLALIGFAIGVPISIVVMRVLESMDESVRVLGVAPVASIAAVLLGVAALAAWLPAKRAACVDPLNALRSE